MRKIPNPPTYRLTSKALHLDFPLLGLLLILMGYGLFILYSASNQNMKLLAHQGFHLIFALTIMLIFAFIPPHKYERCAPWVYGINLILLIAVVVMGKIGKGAQRWLELGGFRFQPSELMKLAIPLMVAWFCDRQGAILNLKQVFSASLIIFIPALLIAKQPDLGTALMVSAAGFIVIFLAGLPLRILFTLILCISVSIPFAWQHMHDYQKQRVMTLLHPENDPLGKGYHIIQSKIAIGSGGTIGKGWLKGSQSHLNFLPEHATDFIFAVIGEELGFFGTLAVIILMILITLRSLYIARFAQTNFSRLLAASLAMGFFFSAFVNIGMVIGILPVVGIPLPLVSYGGSAMLTFLTSFGLLMSISSHRILFNKVT